MIGNGMTNSLGNTSFPLLDTVLTLSKPAQQVFKEITNKREYEKDYVEYINTNMTKRLFYQGINELIEKQLIIRVKQDVYMINPYAMIKGDEENRLRRQQLWINNGGKKP